MHASSPRHRPVLGAFVLTAHTALPLIGQQAAEGPPRRHWDVADVVAVSPDGRLLASGGNDFRVILWDVAGGRKLQDKTGHKWVAADLAFSPDGRVLASGSAATDKTLRLWEAATGKSLRTLRVERSARSLAYDPNGRFIVVAEENRVGVWDPESGSLLRTLATELYFPEIGLTFPEVALSADGRTVAATGIGWHPPASTRASACGTRTPAR